jgi:hypothetical protein
MAITKKSTKAIFKSQQEIGDILYNKLKEEKDFTGKIVYTIHCNGGGIGGTEAAVQRDIKKDALALTKEI